MSAAARKAAVAVPVYVLFVLSVTAVWPPQNRDAFASYVIIALFGLICVFVWCLPKPAREGDDWDVVDRVLRVLPPDGGER